MFWPVGISVLGQDVDPLKIFTFLLRVDKLEGNQFGGQILTGAGTIYIIISNTVGPSREKSHSLFTAR